MSKQSMKMLKRIIVPVILLALSFYAKHSISQASDDVVNTSFWKYDINNMHLVMSEGAITIKATSKAAEPGTSIRYQTIGFGITLQPTSKNVKVESLQGKDWHGPAAPNFTGEILLNDGNILGSEEYRGMVTTTFFFDAQKVDDALKNTLNSIEKDTVVYLHAIFQTYERVDENTKIIRKGKATNERPIGIRSWQEIMKAEPWSYGSLEGFEKYYNIPLQFAPGKQQVDLYYSFEGTEVKKGEIGKYFINAKVTWSGKNIQATETYKGKSYRISGFYVRPIVSGRAMKGITVNGNFKPGILDWYGNEKDPPDKVFDIAVENSSAIVPWGGMKVVMVYKLIPDKTNKLYYEYNGMKTYVKDLANKKAGEKLGWASEAEEKNAELKEKYNYKLTGYYVLSNKDATKRLGGGTIAEGLTEEKILNSTVTVVEGGVAVILTYDSAGDLPTPTPKPTPPAYETPQGGYESKTLSNFSNVGEIRADLRGQERFNVLQGIPTTESLYTQVRGTEYNISYAFTKRVVEKTYSITVQKDYVLTWTDAKDEEKTMTDTVPVIQTISVKRACAYWEITQFNYYTLDRAVIYNKALPGGSCTMYPDYRYYSPPSVSINHRGIERNHIIDPPQAAPGFIIKLQPESLSGDGEKPTVPPQDFTYEANAMTEEIKVINDYLSFGGAVVLDGGTYTKEAPPLTNVIALNTEVGLSDKDVLYRPDQVIAATLLNDVYSSSGTLIYKNHPSAVGSMSGSKEFQIQGLNSVTVHTPVICDASITTTNTSTNISSNDPYVQVLNINQDCVQLVLDPDSNLSDFTVDISNYGEHLYSPGYLTRDFAWGIRDNTVSYIAKYNNIYRNEVKFPFDVFYRNPTGKDEFIPKNTWMRFGHSTPTFYLPMWVDEGIYTVDFRTIAVNGVNTESQLSRTQAYANINRSNYVATDTVRVQVSGRIYGLTLYDVTDYPTWETVFRVKKDSARLKLNEGYPSGIKSAKYNEGYAYDYAVGLKDQYGNVTGRRERFTIPLVNGSHPKIDNVGVLKTGYAVKFKVNTIGNAFSSGDSVTIKPRFYYVDAKGKNRREVDVYYNEYFNNKRHTLVKIGSSLDQTNIKKYQSGDQYLAIPDKQLKMMADMKKIDLNKYRLQKTDLFTYGTIRMAYPLMTYINTDYLLNLKAGDQYEKIRAAGITDTDIVNRMQTYYAEYFLPADIKVVEKGFDVYGYAAKYGVSSHESFWLTDGYLIVNFDIYTTRGSTKNLSYTNVSNAAKGYCSMWNMEGAVSGKVSYNGRRDPSTIFEFHPGDFMIYYSSKNVRDDYVTYIIN